MSSIQQLNERIQQEALFTRKVVDAVNQVIVGQEYLVTRLLIAMLTNGHLLVEGVPGLAKTLAVRTLAATIDADFQRIQFTP
ncbi:MAG: ATPase, partial [Chloroflexi bacterium]